MPIKKTTKLPFFMKEVKRIELDLSKIPTNTYFTATVGTRKIEGLVYNHARSKRLYFCQNNIPGSDEYKLGYLHSWVITYTGNQVSLNNTFKNLQFPDKPKGFKPPVQLPEIAGYTPSIIKGGVQFGCRTVSNKLVRLLAANLQD